MIGILILLLLGVLECMIFRKSRLGMLCILFILAVTAWPVWKWPQIVTWILLISHFVNHRHFIIEEKIYAVMVILGFMGIWYTQIGIVSAGLLFVILEYIHLRILKREEDKTSIYQNRLLKNQVDEMETLYKTMRGWRHDYHNHLQSLKSYLHLDQKDKMEKYLNELEQDLDTIDQLYHSGNLQLDAILNAKLAIAQQRKITVKCDSEIPAQLTVSDIDLCVILGNLLDNAIESCDKLADPKEKFIRIYVNTLKQQLYISITNATNEDIRIRTEDYFTNKRGDHGHGLRRVDQVVKKYDGYLNRQNEPGVFATEIVLPL